MGKYVYRKKTCISNINDLQFGLIQTGQQLINRDDIAAALAKRNILRQVKTIQFSSNIKFVSIEFDTSTIKETSCLETVKLKENLIATFMLDCKKPQKIPKTFTFISFLNVPFETNEKLLTDFVDQFADIEGSQIYPKKCMEK